MDKHPFIPQLFVSLKTYSKKKFFKDLMAGIIVGVVALPLAIAFAIASGVSPEKGLYTAIIAGFIISALGGSRVQIGGPTGAFIVIVYGIVQQYGIDGLIVATFIAGIILVLMGLLRLGIVIKFIPHPLIVGFTTGIAVIIFSSQMKDLFGLKMGAVPADFIGKWQSYAAHFDSVNIYALVIAVATIAIGFLWPLITHKVPGSLIAIVLTTVVVYFFHIPVETIGSRFGSIPSHLPTPVIPHISFEVIQNLVRPAFAIALLGGIESLLSAVVADGMIGSRHKSNMELIAQGIANVCSAIFGGIPATGAIARTATNIKNGGRTPVAGMVHALTLLIIMLFVGKWAALIPLSTLAGILVIVAYNMSEWKNFISIIKLSRSDASVLIVTFLLTVLTDLMVAMEVGMVLAAFLFMANMTHFSNVEQLTNADERDDDTTDNESIGNYELPDRVIAYEINGPLFFGAAYKFRDAISIVQQSPQVLILRMRHVPIIDATGLHTLQEVKKQCRQMGTKVILSEVNSKQVMGELRKGGVIARLGEENICATMQDSIDRSKKLMEKKI